MVSSTPLPVSQTLWHSLLSSPPGCPPAWYLHDKGTDDDDDDDDDDNVVMAAAAAAATHAVGWRFRTAFFARELHRHKPR